MLALSGHLLAVVGGEHAEGGALLDLALQMNPNSAEAWRLGGWVSAWGGDTERALQRLIEAERLDPLSPLQADVHSARSVALLVGRRFPEAVGSGASFDCNDAGGYFLPAVSLSPRYGTRERTTRPD